MAENAKDMDFAAKKGLSAAMTDRLLLNEDRIEAMAQGLDDVAALPDPVGRTLAEWKQPNGLNIARVSVPLGVIGIIYESRPNVTADAGSLCLKSGNAAILRGGSGVDNGPAQGEKGNPLAGHRPGFSPKRAARPLWLAPATPRSVIRPVTNRAGVTSKA